MFCEIRVKGHLSAVWAEWLDGLVIINEANGEAVLRGALPDQAALFGLLNRLQSMNVALVSVTNRPDTLPHDSSSDE